jgi:hypothetical protein
MNVRTMKEDRYDAIECKVGRLLLLGQFFTLRTWSLSLGFGFQWLGNAIAFSCPYCILAIAFSKDEDWTLDGF